MIDLHVLINAFFCYNFQIELIKSTVSTIARKYNCIVTVFSIKKCCRATKSQSGKVNVENQNEVKSFEKNEVYTLGVSVSNEVENVRIYRANMFFVYQIYINNNKVPELFEHFPFSHKPPC